MGPGEAEKGVGDGKEVATCSVCLEAVTGRGGRATARLLCRHQFHLDCIGSAFNVKGVMECPNCREVEKGCWLYANGPHTPRNVRMGERIHDGELSNFHHLEMVHIQDSDYYAFTFTWMPLWFMPATPFIFFPRSITYIAESGKPNTCLVSSSSKWIIDSGATYHMRDLRTKKIIDKGYEFEGLYILDAQPFGVHWCPIGRLATIPLPFELGVSNSNIQSLVPLYPRALVSINQQDYYHNLQNVPGSMVPPMSQVGVLRSIRLTSPLPDHARYFLFPSMSGQNMMGGGDEIIPRHQFYTWECERFTPYPLVSSFHVESSGWRPFAQPTNGGWPESLICAPICLARMHS